MRKGDEVDSITLERAAELLVEKRAKGPAKKSTRPGARKTAAKKTTAKKAPAKKAPAKKAAAKKTTVKNVAP